jgi:N,N'-diacetyllegionaminate synthase
MPEIKLDRPFVIAEMGNAHEGIALDAKSIIDAAFDAGADAIKFQVFTPDELAVKSFSYYELYGRLQMSTEAWSELVAYAHQYNMVVMSDVFGIDSANQMIAAGVDGFKIHAADVANTELLRKVASTGLPIMLSTGGSTWIETSEALSVLRGAGKNKIILMHGFQSYPTKLTDSSLRRIPQLRSKFGLPVGYASHVDGASLEAVQLPAWAIAAGADVVEVHITLDRSKQGSDYFSSLEPDRFKEMVNLVRNMEPALGESSLRMPVDEQSYRVLHKKQLVAIRDIHPGDVLDLENVALKRTNQKLTGRALGLDMAVGHKASRFIQADSPIQLGDLKMKVVAALACRLESTRLYGKPFQLVGDRPILQHLIDRLRKVEALDEIVLAISDTPGSGVFIEYAKKEGLSYVLGPEKDVLGRLILAAESANADIVLRTTTENPYPYWENLDDLIRLHIEQNADITVTDKLPLGSFVEVISLDALKKSHKFGEDRHRSELCTLFISENPDIFMIQRILAPDELQHPEYRLTVDTPQDLMLVRTLWEELHEDQDPVSLGAIVEYLNTHPQVAAINSQFQSLHLWK